MVTVKRYFGKFKKPHRWHGWRRFVRYMVLPAVAALLLLTATRALLVTQVSLPDDYAGDSMLRPGDRLLVWRMAFGRKLPARGELVVYDLPGADGSLAVGRISATAGDTVEGRRLPDDTVRIGRNNVAVRRIAGRVVCVSYSADSRAPWLRRLRRDRFFLRVR